MAITPDDERDLEAIVEDASLDTVVSLLAHYAGQGIGLPDAMHEQDRTRIQSSLLMLAIEIDKTVRRVRGQANV
jgi:hypothetical protein